VLIQPSLGDEVAGLNARYHPASDWEPVAALIRAERSRYGGINQLR